MPMYRWKLGRMMRTLQQDHIYVASVPDWRPCFNRIELCQGSQAGKIGGLLLIRIQRWESRAAVESIGRENHRQGIVGLAANAVHHSTMIRLGDLVFGSSGDFGPAPMTAIDVRTGN